MQHASTTTKERKERKYIVRLYPTAKERRESRIEQPGLLGCVINARISPLIASAELASINDRELDVQGVEEIDHVTGVVVDRSRGRIAGATVSR